MKLNKPKKIKERFLILPFHCNRCGDLFMLEHGAIENRSYYVTIWDRIGGFSKYYKYCYECAAIEFEKQYGNKKE